MTIGYSIYPTSTYPNTAAGNATPYIPTLINGPPTWSATTPITLTLRPGEGITFAHPLTHLGWTYSAINNSTTYVCKWSGLYPLGYPGVQTPGERLKEIIRSRQAPAFVRNRANPYDKFSPMKSPEDLREARARDTLRKIIGDDKYKSFLRSGYVTVRGRSGKAYQVFPSHGITNVYANGKLEERLCVVFEGNFPPTDSVIMRVLLIMNSETTFRKKAVTHGTHGYGQQLIENKDQRTLPEIYADLKRKVA